MTDRYEDREILRKGGFAENEVVQLSKLRKDYSEREKNQAQIVKRRLEFIRWLVSTGKLSDQIA
ncbi:hypothetical protein [Dictyobacter aurantiacus]|uniref:Uncharacterized protein n=1 Tax=Dictyobacter aurantiacus TaxID=1936993 RepID=A0A401ZJK5_9CHLR|nr:hypothetical protein [Dictyobacter aurantiacus]GCE07004.1 hypothetical protein KDAU_43330 [Dictyobacter aurantiacus]